MKNKSVVFVVALGLGVIAASLLFYNFRYSAKPPTAPQKENLARIAEEQPFLNMPDCEGEFVTLKLGGVKLKVKRRDQLTLLTDDRELRGLAKPSKYYNCEDTIEGVVSLRDHRLLIGDRPEKRISSGYQGAFRLFEDHNAVLNRSTDDNGVEHIRILSVDSDTLKLPPEGARSEYFVLPNDLSPTESGEPILYTCGVPPPPEQSSKGYCRTAYYHASGLYVSSDFRRRDASVEYLIKEHKKHLEVIRGMLMMHPI